MSKGCPSSKIRVRARVEEERHPGVAVDLGMEKDCSEEVWCQENLAVTYFSIWAMSRAPCPNVDRQVVLGLGFGLRKGDGWSCYCLGVEKASVGSISCQESLDARYFFIWATPGAPCL